MAPSNVGAEVGDKIALLPRLSRAELAARWTAIFGSSPPKGVKRGLLERACAYEVQAKAFGGLKRSVRRSLLAKAAGKPTKPSRPRHALRPGARLVREWHGAVHQVDVSGSRFVWRGQSYRSLSAVARAITGTAWSGPRFFGL
jgi:hypothetical protein